jgi:hypothetical protein
MKHCSPFFIVEKEIPLNHHTRDIDHSRADSAVYGNVVFFILGFSNTNRVCREEKKTGSKFLGLHLCEGGVVCHASMSGICVVCYLLFAFWYLVSFLLS